MHIIMIPRNHKTLDPEDFPMKEVTVFPLTLETPSMLKKMLNKHLLKGVTIISI